MADLYALLVLLVARVRIEAAMQQLRSVGTLVSDLEGTELERSLDLRIQPRMTSLRQLWHQVDDAIRNRRRGGETS